MNTNNADLGRPGQQLLPGYVVKLLKTLKIPFGTDRTMNGVDVDPTIPLIAHIIDCLGALRDVNKVYRGKGSLASRSVGTRVMFGFTAELGNVLLDAITFDPPSDLSDSSIYYSQVSSSILNVFPEIAAQVTPSTGKVLLHHTALKGSRAMALESIKTVIKAFPAGAWTTDRTGALPLHWITHNPHCTQEMINFIINANPKGPWVADMDGYLPLHWAVNQDEPNIDVVASLIAANASACAKCCLKGSLPLHWCLNRDVPSMSVVKALLQVHSDGVRTFDKTGWLPIHQCVNRSEISLEALSLLIELYPQGLQCPNVNGQLPLHRALDQNNPSVEAVSMMIEHFPGGAKIADDEGYLPIHLALDCIQPNAPIARSLLDQYPESAFHKSKDGLLPLHCIISSMNPVVEIIEALLQIFPDSVESMAVDVIPVDEMADPETWQGDWVEKRWTPLSRAIDRGLDAIVILFRDALHMSKTGEATGLDPNSPTSGMKTSNVTTRNLNSQSNPPINNLTNMMSNMSVEKKFNSEGAFEDDNMNSDVDGHYMTDVTDQRRQRLQKEQYQENFAPDLTSPPTLKDRMPGGSVVGERRRDDRSPDRRRNKEKRHHSRSRRDKEHRRHNSRSRRDRYDDDDDYDSYEDRDRDRDRDRSRRHRSSSRTKDRHRDKDKQRHKDRRRNYDEFEEEDEREARERLREEKILERDVDEMEQNEEEKRRYNNTNKMPSEQPPESLLQAAQKGQHLPRPQSGGSNKSYTNSIDRPKTKRGISNADQMDTALSGSLDRNSRDLKDGNDNIALNLSTDQNNDDHNLKIGASLEDIV